ncbi:DUF5666 domain-containing protein [Ktedonobacter racemifer]|uniref:DUF5666 domain-containing protein n=1 Tax=Ktedonobacter racemifer DSM 44963 TaxID=485913 RepID=D6TP87_KTERA|nr:DUF5666 domain-containing protein [Ktedonobacter racemifer]EFH87443.1 hypothetical protein Krac_8775 [Ktedonobacter racemifer DSM 44963]
MSEERNPEVENSTSLDKISPRSPRFKPVHLYALVGTCLMLASFVAGGIFMHTAQASTNASLLANTNLVDLSKCNPGKQPDPNVANVLGTITAINGSSLTLRRYDNGATVSVTTTSTTEYGSKLADKAISSQDLKVGDFIQASGTYNAEKTLTAKSIKIGLPPSSSEKKPSSEGDKQKLEKLAGSATTNQTGIVGRITAIHGATLTVSGFNNGKTYTVNTSTSTEFASKIAGHSISLSELKVGDFIMADGKLASNGSLDAQQLTVGPPPSDTPACKQSSK